jgi:hypothetical protein
MFYAYENKPHKRVTIHAGTCGACGDGTGTWGVGTTENGGWTRGYTTIDEVRAAVAGRQPTIRECGLCLRPESL